MMETYLNGERRKTWDEIKSEIREISDRRTFADLGWDENGYHPELGMIPKWAVQRRASLF